MKFYGVCKIDINMLLTDHFLVCPKEATKPIPVTSFKCQDQGLPGYYGDVETGCTVSRNSQLRKSMKKLIIKTNHKTNQKIDFSSRFSTSARRTIERIRSSVRLVPPLTHSCSSAIGRQMSTARRLAESRIRMRTCSITTTTKGRIA